MGTREPRLVAGMIVHNEAGRYLPMVLKDLQAYCDRIVILDDGSTDATPQICQSFSRVLLHRQTESLFWTNESALRIKLWNLVLTQDPDWILAIDADEMLEPRFKQEKARWLTQKEYPVIAFRLYEFWNSLTHYRVDKLWNPQMKMTPMLVRHQPGSVYHWLSQPLHCGRIPMGLGPFVFSGLRCKHFGYANPQDHRRKYEMYTRHDPEGRFSPRSHYDSILDENPILEPWQD
ncbi:MAG: glycosyltransferase family 2 protein [Firmicutes bacterium]|nr:glycosyltransferase family 2 protein [Bacillota bacterium]MCL5014995.1 glycosyltransferase family 2 protein [Bacillota bacterium]